MLSKVRSFALCGLEGREVQVEIDIGGGLPALETVGLPDAAVKESKERVRAAVRDSNMGITPWTGRISPQGGDFIRFAHSRRNTLFQRPA